jgi:NADH:ubiquinone oxidoreductase subunit 6 (subunit J)
MILEVLSIGIIVSACLALFLDEIMYSIAALSITFVFTALLYYFNGAVFAAIFQFAIGIGTLAILFLSGDTLSDKSAKKASPMKLAILFGSGVVLSFPAILLSGSNSTAAYSNASFGDALWNLSAVDVILQALVILMIALGIAIILYEQRDGGK